MNGLAAPGRRWWIWLPMLGLAGWLAAFGENSPGTGAAAVSEPVRTAPAGQAAPTSPTSQARVASAGAEPEPIEALLERNQWFSNAPAERHAQVRRDLFSTRSWNPPAPAPAPAAAAAPVAPPMPFVFLGKKLEGGAWEVYLSRGEQTFIAREGQTLDQAYRVDKIAPPGLTLTYLPLGQIQKLAIGDMR